MSDKDKKPASNSPSPDKGGKSKDSNSDLGMNIDFGSSKPKKVIRGAFQYNLNGNIYCEENFEIYRDKKEMLITYFSESMSRVSTGELLKISVEYQVTKDYVPQKVIVKKDLGKEKVEEIFKFDSKKNILSYTFKNKRSKHTQQVNTSPRFHVFTPSACTSILFFLSKKFDATSKNIYFVISSKNQWEYEHPVDSKMVALEKISLTSDTIKIGGQEVQAVHYKLIEDNKNEGAAKDAKPATIQVFLSRHYAVPYQLIAEDGTIIQIKYLNNLDDEE